MNCSVVATLGDGDTSYVSTVFPLSGGTSMTTKLAFHSSPRSSTVCIETCTLLGEAELSRIVVKLTSSPKIKYLRGVRF